MPSPYDRRISLAASPTTAAERRLAVVERMIVYFESMIDEDSKRFYLLSHPQSLEAPRTTTHCPLRDMGSAWDATKAVKILRQKNSDSNKLLEAILQTTEYYSSSLLTANGAMHLCPEILGEPPNIAHNALLLLALVGSESLGVCDSQQSRERIGRMDGLASGILKLQRPDGAFGTQFLQSNNSDDDNDISRGIAFLPGQAMTALTEVYLCSMAKEETLDKILPAMLRALAFYRRYYEEGSKENTIDANYSIWQIQAICRLVVVLRETTTSSSTQQEQKTIALQDASHYCVDMCHDILGSPSWKMLRRGQSFYPNLSTVEIACGLDSVCQTFMVLENEIHEDKQYFELQMNNALDFLEWSQDQVPPDVAFGYGGLGYGGTYVAEQRLDVTGHALSALANLVMIR